MVALHSRDKSDCYIGICIAKAVIEKRIKLDTSDKIKNMKNIPVITKKLQSDHKNSFSQIPYIIDKTSFFNLSIVDSTPFIICPFSLPVIVKGLSLNDVSLNPNSTTDSR